MKTCVDCGHGWDDRRGVVLIVVLVLVVMLSLAGFGFLSAMSTEYEAARLNGALLQARQTLVSAETQLLWLTGQPRIRREVLGGLYNNPGLFRGRPVEGLQAVGTEAGVAGQGLTTAAGSAAIGQFQSGALLAGPETWRFSVVSIDRPVGGAAVQRFGLTSESAKLHLGTVLRWEQARPDSGRQALLRLPGMTDVIADSLLDWMDADDVPRAQGAESEYYQTQGSSVRPLNAVPASLQDLLAVRGISAQLLYGTGAGAAATAAGTGNEASGLLSSPEGGDPVVTQPLAELTAETFGTANDADSALQTAATRPLCELLTVWSAERLVQPDGALRVNLNQPNLSAVRSGLQGRVPEAVVQYALLVRSYGLAATIPAGLPEQSVGEVSVPANAVGALPLKSLGDLVDSAVVIPAVGTRVATVVRSPLQSAQADSDLTFRQLQDAACVEAGPVIAGRISLQESGEEVLRSVPGVTAEQAAGLVAQRARLQPFERRSLLWPVRAGVFTVEQWRAVLPELTDVGDVFQAELIVFRAVGGPLLRRKLILDTAAGTAKRVYWRNVTDERLEFGLESLAARSEDVK